MLALRLAPRAEEKQNIIIKNDADEEEGGGGAGDRERSAVDGSTSTGSRTDSMQIHESAERYYRAIWGEENERENGIDKDIVNAEANVLV